MNVDKGILELLADGPEPDPAHAPQHAHDHPLKARIQTARSLSSNVEPDHPALAEIDALLRDRRVLAALRLARRTIRLGLRDAAALIEERQYALGLRTPGSGFSLLSILRKPR